MHTLRFQPIFRRYLWGGRRLATELGRPIGDGDDYAESWEIVDHGVDQSTVLAGPLAGRTLHELVERHGADLFGQHHPQQQFPLLFKFLDAQRNLSLQVHPNDELARRLDPSDLGKTEAWVILDRRPGSKIYAGLKWGFDRPALEREIARDTVELCLHAFEPEIGDCVLLPAGTIHAIGEGLLVAEIQQASDTTYRVYDWNRLGPDGKLRELHIDAALEAIDFDQGPISAQMARPGDAPHIQNLVSCDKFVLDRWQLDGPQSVGGDNRFHIFSVLEGAVAVADDPTAQPLGKGETALLPAVLGRVEIVPQDQAILLDIYLPAVPAES